MNRQHSAFCTNSGQYVGFLRYTSTSAVMMASSSSVPGAHGWNLRVERVNVPVNVEDGGVPQEDEDEPCTASRRCAPIR